jgi:mRNA interferase MazF
MTAMQGQIWSVDLDPTVANEQAGTRPCIVVSRQRFNAMPIRHAIVVPLTTRQRGLPHHVEVVDDGGLDYPSWAMCEGVRALSTQRFVRLIGTASPGTVEAVTRRVTKWLNRP